MFSLKRLRPATLILLAFACITNAQSMSEEAIIDRISSIGSVRLSSDETIENTVEAPAAPRTAKSIYNSFCTVCHAAGIAGAPKLGDKVAWSTRLEKGRETINRHAIQGINAMPARGTCMNCSDEEIIQTIDYMLAQ